MLNHFTFNGKSTAELGLLVSGVNIYGSPSRIVEKVNIPYRSGDLIIDTGAYANYLVSYEVSVIDDTKATLEEISNWLLSSRGYQQLTDTYNPEYYRMAAYYNQIDYTMSAFYRFGKAVITFDCKPQKYLLTGTSTTQLTANGTITNPTQMASKPLLRIYGTGTLTVGTTPIVVNSVDSYVDVDCDTMQVFKGTENKGNTVTITEFPQLVSGSNSISLSGITKVIITPRWWKL